MRTKQRTEFLAYILAGAIECGPYGSWMAVHEYHIPEDNEAEWFAVLSEWDEDTDEEEWPRHRVDLDVIAHGLAVIRNAQLDIVETRVRSDGSEKEVSGWVNDKTRERLYMSSEQRVNILLCDRTNAEEGDMDVIDYLAILECALFGQVVYA